MGEVALLYDHPAAFGDGLIVTCTSLGQRTVSAWAAPDTSIVAAAHTAIKRRCMSDLPNLTRWLNDASGESIALNSGRCDTAM